MDENPYSTPESKLERIDPAEYPGKKIWHALAYVFILAVWFWGVIATPDNALQALSATHTTVIALLDSNYDPTVSMGNYQTAVFTVEGVFLSLFCAALWRRSMKFTLGVLTVVILWNAINIVYAFIVFF